MRTGFYVIGKLLGYRTVENTNRETGELRTRHFIAVEFKEPNNYGGYNTVTQEMRVDEKTFNSGFKNMVDGLKDKMVQVLVFPREWAMEGGRTGIIYNFNENSVIDELRPSK